MARCAEKDKEQKNWQDVRRKSRKSGEMCGEGAGKVVRCAEKEQKKWRDVRRNRKGRKSGEMCGE